jgi:hypothetical protein
MAKQERGSQRLKEKKTAYWTTGQTTGCSCFKHRVLLVILNHHFSEDVVSHADYFMYPF